MKRASIIMTILVVGFLFDRAMQFDADYLCATDATAYDGCQDR